MAKKSLLVSPQLRSPLSMNVGMIFQVDHATVEVDATYVDIGWGLPFLQLIAGKSSSSTCWIPFSAECNDGGLQNISHSYMCVCLPNLRDGHLFFWWQFFDGKIRVLNHQIFGYHWYHPPTSTIDQGWRISYHRILPSGKLTVGPWKSPIFHGN